MGGFIDQDGIPADYEPHERPRRAKTGCACFAPGDAPGICPGQENCPLCQDDDTSEASE